MYIGSAQSFGCQAGDRKPSVLESSVPTAGPGKPLFPAGRGTIALCVIQVLHWSGRASTWDVRISEHDELGMLGMKEQFDSPELCRLAFPSH